MQVRAIQEALKQYTVEGTFGHLLDAESDTLALSRFTTFEIEHLMGMGEKCALPVLLYLFRRIERRIAAQAGKPTAIFSMKPGLSWGTRFSARRSGNGSKPSLKPIALS